jgi:hypothetical protein
MEQGLRRALLILGAEGHGPCPPEVRARLEAASRKALEAALVPAVRGANWEQLAAGM